LSFEGPAFAGPPRSGSDVAGGPGIVQDGRQALGRLGEALAVAELERRGYVILARRYRRRGGELDIVARDGRTIAFVEVKARKGLAFGRGVESVTWAKRRRMTSVALDFLARHHLQDRPCRFDVVAIDVADGTPRLQVYQNAFDAAG
jgi:putative endonuclease